MITRFILIIALICLSGCAATPKVEYLNSPELESLNLPFSQAVRVGNTLYLSGQVGNLPGTWDLVSGGVVPETRQVLENIKAILEAHGSSLD